MGVSGNSWLISLEPEERLRAEMLIERFALLGVPDPAPWAQSEILENIPQLAKAIILNYLWNSQIMVFINRPSWIEEVLSYHTRFPKAPFADGRRSLERLVHLGAAPEDISLFARLIAYEAIFAAMEIIDDMNSREGSFDQPSWRLMECDSSGGLTGRQITGLHESILELDKLDDR